MHAQDALLLHGLDRNEMHVRAARRLADGSRIVGVVLAALALQAIGRDQVSGDDAGIKAHGTQSPRPMVRAGAGLHGHHAAGGQLRAPGQEFVSAQGAASDALPGSIYRVNLNHALGQIDTDSCNLTHGTSPFKGFRLTSKTNLGTSMPSPESGKSLRIPLGA